MGAPEAPDPADVQAVEEYARRNGLGAAVTLDVQHARSRSARS
jgi:hypothetical protein